MREKGLVGLLLFKVWATIEAPFDFVIWDVAAAVACKVPPAEVGPNKSSASFVISFLPTLVFSFFWTT